MANQKKYGFRKCMHSYGSGANRMLKKINHFKKVIINLKATNGIPIGPLMCLRGSVRVTAAVGQLQEGIDLHP